MQIRDATQKGTSISYGTNVFAMYVGSHFDSPLLALLLLLLLSGVVLLMGVAFIYLNHKDVKEHLPNSPDLDAFRMGSGIYLGTFMLGNNFDYRLVFLLFTIPQLVAWASDSSVLVKWTARLTTLAVLISLWSFVIFRPFVTFPYGNALAFALDELANWSLLAGLLYLLIASLPQWLWHDSLILQKRILALSLQKPS